MKNSLYLLFTLGIIAITLNSCVGEYGDEILINSNSNQKSYLAKEGNSTESDNYFYELIGISYIEKIKDQKSTYVIHSIKKTLNGYNYNLDGLNVIVDSDPDYNRIQIIPDGKENGLQEKISYIFFKKDPNKNRDLILNEIVDDNYLDDEKKTAQYIIASIILSSIDNKSFESEFVKYDNITEGGKVCDRIIASIRISRSNAIGHLNSAVKNFLSQHSDCHTVYGVDSGCLWEDYLCVASQSIQCNGGGCDAKYGSL